jgi:pterin-4a-carbinolamine dehydratase
MLARDYPNARLELRRAYRFPSFKKAMEFMQTACDPIQKATHHPRWENQWRTVVVYLSTWDIGGDFARSQSFQFISCTKAILPIWHGLGHKELLNFAPWSFTNCIEGWLTRGLGFSFRCAAAEACTNPSTQRAARRSIKNSELVGFPSQGIQVQEPRRRDRFRGVQAELRIREIQQTLGDRKDREARVGARAAQGDLVRI